MKMADKAKKKRSSLLHEFREFAMRGNVMDLAVGVIIGAAFQKIVNSMVSDIIMPLVGRIFGSTDFSNLFIPLSRIPETADPSKLDSLAYVRDELGVAVFAYGSFITAVINFIILAAVIFLMIKGINKLSSFNPLKHKEEAPAPAPTEKTCPYCCSTIPIEATRCPHCTSVLEEHAGGQG